jgi:S-DNA-T family DNA segregation ATPase FtsK/SpoIIIE
LAVETMRRLRREIFGLILWALAIFLLMSLLSYSPEDPSLNQAGGAAAPIRNWTGIVGAYVSDALLQAFGWASYLLPLSGVILGWGFIRQSGMQWRKMQWLGLFTSCLAVPAALHLLWGSQTGVTAAHGAGGLVGYLIASVLLRYLNEGGTWLVVGMLLCTSVLLISRTTIAQVLGGLWKSASCIIRWILRAGRRLSARIGSMIGKAFKPKTELRTFRRALQAQPAIVEPPKEPPSRPKKPKQESFAFVGKAGYGVPPFSLLDEPPASTTRIGRESLKMNARLLEKKLQDFGVEGRVTEVHPGPIVTLYEFEPAPGVKISRIVSLHDDLALVLRAMSVRIIAPIPGKGAVGIEIPNAQRDMVYLRELLDSEPFQKSSHVLTVGLGKDTVGRPVVANLVGMPHLLIAGATGTGKSVCLNAIISSILFKASPDEVKFLMIDPKRLELSVYKDIPHLLHPVVVEPKKAATALVWAVREMERRYRLMEQIGVRNIDRYNARMARYGGAPPMPEPSPDLEAEETEDLPERLPYIVLVIDELSDLMMVASRSVEDSVLRLAQMARAAGVHLVVATQRPSVDVLTGTIKINLPVRIAFQVTSKFDSRTILDTQGAEHLLGSGDMLFLPPGTASIQRIHGAYVSEGEIRRVCDFLKEQARPEYDPTVLRVDRESDDEMTDEDLDEKYDEAVALVTRLRQASVSLIQRHLRVGYNRAARMIERMEAEGVVGPSDGSKPREVLARALE